MVQSLWKKQIFKHRVTTWPSSTHPRHTPKRNENIHPHIKLHTVYTVALFIMTRERKKPKCSSSDGWIKQCGIDFKCILLSHKKKVRNTWYNRDEPRKHYATGKEASHNRLYILHDSLHGKCPEQANLQRWEDQWLLRTEA